jgi:hypothetical protein
MPRRGTFPLSSLFSCLSFSANVYNLSAWLKSQNQSLFPPLALRIFFSHVKFSHYCNFLLKRLTCKYAEFARTPLQLPMRSSCGNSYKTTHFFRDGGPGPVARVHAVAWGSVARVQLPDPSGQDPCSRLGFSGQGPATVKNSKNSKKYLFPTS